VAAGAEAASEGVEGKVEGDEGASATAGALADSESSRVAGAAAK
jgi:hypothetical protein